VYPDLEIEIATVKDLKPEMLGNIEFCIGEAELSDNKY
jgi:hypothetical protein